MPEGPMTRTETKGERKRTLTTKQNTSNSSYSVEEVIPPIISLGTKPFVISKSGLTFVQEWKSFDIKEKVDLFVCFFL